MAYRSQRSSVQRSVGAPHAASTRTAAQRSAAVRGTSSRTTSTRASVASSARSQRSSRSAEAPFFGQAAPVLRPDYQEENYRPDIRIISAGTSAGAGAATRAAARTQGASSVASTAVKMAAIVIVLVAVLSFVRIALTSSSVTTMIQSDALSAQISEARSAGTSLEMEQSVLKNPSAVKAQAKQLGMSAPSGATTITLEPDVVAINNGDTLSLSDTIKNVVEVAE